MIRKNKTVIIFYLFLVLGFFCLTIFTTKNVSAQLALIGVTYGDFVPFEEYFQKDEELPKRISFVGDVMLARHVETLMSQHGSDYVFKKIDSLNSKNNYLIGNFEGSIPKKHKKTPDFNLTFSVDDKYVSELQAFGFTHLSLANNHSLDYKKSGYTNTVKVLSKNELQTFGHPTAVNSNSITYVDVSGYKVAVIGLHTLFVEPNSEELVETFTEANQNSDIQIVYIHWGDEYRLEQNSTQRAFAKKLIALGTDLIVGHHPHVVQGIEKIDDVIVFYSLGNFVFDQYFSDAVRQGLVLDLEIKDSVKIKLKPIISHLASSQPQSMTKEEKQEFLRLLAKRSSSQLEEEILVGEVILPFDLQLLEK